MNVWIQPLADKKKTCRHCDATITNVNRHIGVGEYIRGKYRKGFQVCGQCMVGQINNALGSKGYTIRARSGYSMPWYKEAV
jgi:hypothetical protein